ncbi:FAD-dependent thymidylate synthase [Candidatus Woesearchaeota archaeon]|nr:FAD-dependent thymidylate synthase [Candidatus Woesearchaeota archaeon]
MPNFTPEEKALLAPHVSNIDGQVFVANVLGLTGAIFARYSRARGGFREVLLQEFIREGQLDAQKADDLIRRVLVGFGDDSIGELDGVHLALEGVSNLATKFIEDKRIGGSPIEKSSRYVLFDEKDEQGRFKFLRELRIMKSRYAKDYEDTLNFCFETYCSLIEPMQTHFRRRLSLENAEFKLRENWDGKKRLEELTDDTERRDFEKTYREMIRTKACDTIRVVLPAATLTNVGIFGNGRFFQGLLTEMYSSSLDEMDGLARLAHRELDKYIKRYIERAKPSNYLMAKEAAMQTLATRLFAGVSPRTADQVVLLDNPTNAREYLDHTIAIMLFPFLEHPTEQIREVVSLLPYSKKLEILKVYNGERKNRRDRPGRGLEFGYPFTYDIQGDFGIFRDLHRHRMLTQQRQKLTTRLGFFIPEEIIEVGLGSIVEDARDRSADLYEKLCQDFPYEAQYTVLFGFNVRWNMGMNPRELMHLTEIRTIPQGHSSYRKVAQKMHALASKRNPEIAALMGFVDYNDYPFARGDSEAKIRAKEHILGKK